MIPYGRQDINQEDIKAVVDVLSSDFLTQGPTVERFEGEYCRYVGSKFAVSANSATSCLHVACLALGLGPNNLLWTVPNTFVASANVGLLCGATVDFVDIELQQYNMCADSLEEKLRETAKRNKQLPDVVMPVHFAGVSPDMERIYQLSEEYGFKLIEDASHAAGADYLGQKVGSCKFSDITVFSFHPVKLITTGEGGMATTNDSKLASKMKLFTTHGVVRDVDLLERQNEGPWYYEQQLLGLNYRLTELQAGLGCSQLRRLDSFVERRRQLYATYLVMLHGLSLVLPVYERGSKPSHHLFPVLIDEGCSKSRRVVFEEMRGKGIGVHVHYIPVHTQPYYRDLGFTYDQFPNSTSYYERALSIPISHTMSDSDQDFIVDTLREIL